MVTKPFFVSDTVVHTSNVPRTSASFIKWLGADQDIMPSAISMKKSIHFSQFRFFAPRFVGFLRRKGWVSGIFFSRSKTLKPVVSQPWKETTGNKRYPKVVLLFFFLRGGRLFLKIGSFVETKPMLPDEWFYSFWLNKFVDCAVLQQKLFVFFLCFVFQCYRHDITCRLWQFIRGFQWVPESMRQFAGTTVITDCNFWCRNVGCNILHCNTALLDVFSRSLGAPYRGEFDSKSMFPFLQNSKYIIPTPSSFKKR